MYIESVPNRNSPPAVLLRESFRDAGKVNKRTLANLSKWPPTLIEGLRVLLKGERVAALPENDQLRGTPILVTDRRGDAWTTTLTDVEATPRSWSPIPAGRAGEPTRNGVSNAAGRNTLPPRLKDD